MSRNNKTIKPENIIQYYRLRQIRNIYTEWKTMVIDNTTKYDAIWNSVYSKLSFSPSCECRGHSLNVALPFHINEK